MRTRICPAPGVGSGRSLSVRLSMPKPPRISHAFIARPPQGDRSWLHAVDSTPPFVPCELRAGLPLDICSLVQYDFIVGFVSFHLRHPPRCERSASGVRLKLECRPVGVHFSK